MLSKDLQNHAREFKGYIDSHQYEVSASGIEFPKAGVVARGEYFVSSPGYEDTVEPNLIPTEGLNHLLSVTLSSATKLNTFFLGLYSGNYTPNASLTAANFASVASELVSNTEGYSEASRQLWAPGAANAGTIDNLAARANFTIATASVVTIRGAALLSSQVKGGSTGVVISAARFAQDRLQYNGDVFTLGYRVALSST